MGSCPLLIVLLLGCKMFLAMRNEMEQAAESTGLMTGPESSEAGERAAAEWLMTDSDMTCSDDTRVTLADATSVSACGLLAHGNPACKNDPYQILSKAETN